MRGRKRGVWVLLAPVLVVVVVVVVVFVARVGIRVRCIPIGCDGVCT